MSKKILVVSLSLMAVLLIVSSAMAMSYRYELNGVADAIPEIFENAAEDGVAGFNYTAKYHLPALTLTEFNAGDEDDDGMLVTPDKYKFVWKAEAPEAMNGLNFNFDSDTLTIVGILPLSDDTYEFSIIAEVTECDYKEAIGTRTSFDTDYRLFVHPADHELIVSGSEFDSTVKPAENVDIHKATSNYSVTVRAPQRESHHELVYSAYIESEDGKPVIDLPEWLKYEVSEKVKDSYNDEQIAAVVVTLNSNAKVAEGTKAVVHVMFTVDNEQKYKSVGWEVAYSQEKVEKKAEKEETKPQPKKGWFSW